MRSLALRLIGAAAVATLASCQAFLDVSPPDPGVAAVDAAATSTDTGPGAADVGTGPACPGACAVTVLATNELAPESLTTDGTTLFWVNRTNLGTVAACPLTGCVGGPRILASAELYPYAVAWFGDHLFWSLRDKGSLKVHDLKLGTSTELATGLSAPSALAVYGGKVWLAVDVDIRGSLVECTAIDCTPNALFSYETGTIKQLATQPQGLAWLRDGKTLRACLAGSCFGQNAIATVVDEADGIDAFVGDRDGYFFWAPSGGSKGILRRRPGEASTRVVSDVSGITSLVADSQWLYYASSSPPGVIAKVALDGSSSTILVSPAGSPRSLLLDKALIYWIDKTDGSIRATAR